PCPCLTRNLIVYQTAISQAREASGTLSAEAASDGTNRRIPVTKQLRCNPAGSGAIRYEFWPSHSQLESLGRTAICMIQSIFGQSFPSRIPNQRSVPTFTFTNPSGPGV